MKKLSISYSECDCKKCQKMCHAPCCGTPEDFENIIEAGFGKRLMFDAFPDGEPMLKPALKGYEGNRSPFETASIKGCTFWNGKHCELHSKGLKPSLGKLAHHSLNKEQKEEIIDFINESWTSQEAKDVIAK